MSSWLTEDLGGDGNVAAAAANALDAVVVAKVDNSGAVVAVASDAVVGRVDRTGAGRTGCATRTAPGAGQSGLATASAMFCCVDSYIRRSLSTWCSIVVGVTVWYEGGELPYSVGCG